MWHMRIVSFDLKQEKNIFAIPHYHAKISQLIFFFFLKKKIKGIEKNIYMHLC